MSYIQEMQNRGITVIVERVGLVISHKKPHLACSPDNLAVDTSSGDSNVLFEYKCPYSARELTPLEACTQPKYFYCKFDGGRKKE